jgi:hypothetical protein
MIVLWWLVSMALVVLSVVLLVAGFQGKEGVLRIGQPRDAERIEASGVPSGPSVDAQPEDASGQPSGLFADEQRGQPGIAEGEQPPRPINLPNVAIGTAGVVVGLAALIIFAI